MIATTETYEVTHACGHIKVRPVSRMMEVSIKFGRGTLCDACIKKHEDARTSMLEAAKERCKEIIAETKLRGSQKQIEWANRIRNGLQADALGNYARYVSSTRSTLEKANKNASQEVIEKSMTNILSTRIASIEKVLEEDRSWIWIDRFKDWRDAESFVSHKYDAALKSEIALLVGENA